MSDHGMHHSASASELPFCSSWHSYWVSSTCGTTCSRLLATILATHLLSVLKCFFNAVLTSAGPEPSYAVAGGLLQALDHLALRGAPQRRDGGGSRGRLGRGFGVGVLGHGATLPAHLDCDGVNLRALILLLTAV